MKENERPQNENRARQTSMDKDAPYFHSKSVDSDDPEYETDSEYADEDRRMMRKDFRPQISEPGIIHKKWFRRKRKIDSGSPRKKRFQRKRKADPGNPFQRWIRRKRRIGR